MNGQSCKFEKAYPWCLGRMANHFETNSLHLTNGCFSDKQQSDGSNVLRSRSDLSAMSPCVDQVEEEVMASECKGTIQKHKSDGIPVKKLIAHEISKEENSGNSSPNLIAKLMGLDSFPDQQPGSVNQGTLLGHQRCHSEISMTKWEQQIGILDGVEPHDYAEVREVWSKSLKPNHRDRFVETAKHRKMAFVRHNFNEAKRLSIDEKLRQSKQFQDALEVLNSNKELFLKCLQEPNSVLSQQLHRLQSIPPPAQTKRITVLKPSKTAGGNLDVVDAEHGKQDSKGSLLQLNCFEGGYSPPPGCKSHESSDQPTRIIVLKPSNGKIHADSVVGFPDSVSAEHSENLESRAVAKAITEEMRKKLVRHYRDETMVTSTFSSGCVADDSSFNKSEFGVPVGNLSDSEFMSPASRHSWDYVNRIGSPFSSSSHSALSYSPESSVCREAKKRLSERWAMMAYNGSFQDQELVKKTGSTLGEMLSLSEAKKIAMPGEKDNSAQPKDLKSLFLSDSKPEEYLSCSPPRSLVRSKSVPLLSTPCETKLNLENPVSDKGKPSFPEISRTLSGGISSIRGKVSSLFFSRNKKTSSKDKSAEIEALGDANISCGLDNVKPSHCRPLSVATSSEAFSKPDEISSEHEASVPSPIASGSLCKSQDLQSPISVLDPVFEEAARIPGHLKLERRGSDLPFSSIGSNLIDKSPPIGSISRTISWDDSYLETSSTYPIKDSTSSLGRGKAEEEWPVFLKTLLTMTGLQGEVESKLFLTKWHSPESPLDPSLRDKYIDSDDKGTCHEAKRRRKRSMQKLAFDCVNAALLEIAGYASGSGHTAIPSIYQNTRVNKELPNVSDEVFDWINTLYSSEIRCYWDEFGDENSAAVERVVRKEVVGNGWSNKLRLEMDYLEMEIGWKLMEELVEETVVELICREA